MEKLSAEFGKDLVSLISSLKGLPKNKEVEVEMKSGKKFKFKYTTLDIILEKIKANDKFSLLQPIFHEDGVAYVENILIHTTGEILKSGKYKLKMRDGSSMQDDGAIITYTRRYSLGSFLGVATDEESDEVTGKEIEPEEPKDPEFATQDQIDKIKTVFKDNFGKLLETNNIPDETKMPYEFAVKKIEVLKEMARQKQVADANAE